MKWTLQQLKLLNHSSDLKSLLNDEYTVQIRDGYITVSDVAYLNLNGEIDYGTLIDKLNQAGDQISSPFDHTMYFKGGAPYYANGACINIINSSSSFILSNELSADHYFSMKSSIVDRDYYVKFKRYIDIITGPVKAKYPNFRPKPPKALEIIDGVHKYHDTNSSKAGIVSSSQKFLGQKIGIIGLGGTGSYILDHVAKTMVAEIHIYDEDVLLSHNAFRLPGAVSLDTLNSGIKKVEYHKAIYGNLHNHIIEHEYFITNENVESLKDHDFIFICIDKSVPKKIIVNYLIERKIPFIDVGMGVHIDPEGKLNGIIRATSYLGSAAPEYLNKVLNYAEDDDNEKLYQSNIQIAELNAINAAFAVIQWKKMNGFYSSNPENNLTYTISRSEVNTDNL